MSRRFRIGDNVEVVGMSVARHSPGVKDETLAEKLFRSVPEKVYAVRGFERYGHVERRPPRRDLVWVEYGFLKLRARESSKRQS